MSISQEKRNALIAILSEQINDIDKKIEQIHTAAKETEIDLDKKFMDAFKGVKKTSESVVSKVTNIIEGVKVNLTKLKEAEDKLALIIKALDAVAAEQEKQMSAEARKIKKAEEEIDKEMHTLEAQIDLLLGLEATTEVKLKTPTKKPAAKKPAAKKPAAKKPAAKKPAPAKKPNPKVLESIKTTASQVVFTIDQKAAFAKKLEGKVLKAKQGDEVIETPVKKVEFKDGVVFVTVSNVKSNEDFKNLQFIPAEGKAAAIKVTGSVVTKYVAAKKPAAKKPAPKPAPKKVEEKPVVVEEKPVVVKEEKPAKVKKEKPVKVKKEKVKKEKAAKPVKEDKKAKNNNIDDIMNEINSSEAAIDKLLKNL